jgi:hypothetical protein
VLKEFSVTALLYRTNQCLVFNIHEDNSSITFVEENRNCLNENSCNLKSRQIEPRQNWLARLFHVKPATTSICFSVSKRRARQEVVSLLREWKKYGVKDVIADKDRSVVFGKIGRTNCKILSELLYVDTNELTRSSNERGCICLRVYDGH